MAGLVERIRGFGREVKENVEAVIAWSIWEFHLKSQVREFVSRFVNAIDSITAVAQRPVAAMDERGEIKSIVKLAVGAIVAAAILPTAIENISKVSTTGWDPSAAALWPLIPIFIVLSVALLFVREVTKKL